MYILYIENLFFTVERRSVRRKRLSRDLDNLLKTENPDSNAIESLESRIELYPKSSGNEGLENMIGKPF